MYRFIIIITVLSVNKQQKASTISICLCSRTDTYAFLVVWVLLQWVTTPRWLLSGLGHGTWRNPSRWTWKKGTVFTSTTTQDTHSQDERNGRQKLSGSCKLLPVIYLLPVSESLDGALVGSLVGRTFYIVKHDIVALQVRKDRCANG